MPKMGHTPKGKAKADIPKHDFGEVKEQKVQPTENRKTPAH